VVVRNHVRVLDIEIVAARLHILCRDPPGERTFLPALALRPAPPSKHAAFIRVSFAASLASAINRADDAEACRKISEKLEYGLTRHSRRNSALVT
jgi:hypothetical protein